MNQIAEHLGTFIIIGYLVVSVLVVVTYGYTDSKRSYFDSNGEGFAALIAIAWLPVLIVFLIIEVVKKVYDLGWILARHD